MSSIHPDAKGMPRRWTEEELLEREIRSTIHIVLEFGDFGYERAESGATVATRLLMQLLRERGYVEAKP